LLKRSGVCRTFSYAAQCQAPRQIYLQVFLGRSRPSPNGVTIDIPFLIRALRHQVPIRYQVNYGSPFFVRCLSNQKAPAIRYAVARGKLNRQSKAASFRASAAIAFCGTPCLPKILL